MIKLVKLIFFIVIIQGFSISIGIDKALGEKKIKVSSGPILKCCMVIFSSIQEVKSLKEKNNSLSFCQRIKDIDEKCCRNKEAMQFITEVFLKKKNISSKTACMLLRQLKGVCNKSPNCIDSLLSIAYKLKEKNYLESIGSLPGQELREVKKTCCKDADFRKINMKNLSSFFSKKVGVLLSSINYCDVK